MSTFVVNQTKIFIIFIICGGVIGFLFDFFRVLRKSFKTPDVVTYIEDIAFWLLTCVMLAYTIFRYNNGELRAYIFIGLFIGIIFYILLMSKFIIKISTIILVTVKKVIVKLFKCIIYPFKKFFLFLFNIINKLLPKIYKKEVKKT